MTRIFLANLYHESHGFVPGRTGRGDMVVRSGAELAARRGDGSAVDGLISVADDEGWTVVWGAELAGGAGPVVEEALFQSFLGDCLARLGAALDGGLDGILLALHGAMVTELRDDPEGDFLAAIRAMPGAQGVPIFAVFDLHANMTARMLAHTDALIGYRENPHTDTRESAVRTARLLADCLRTGIRPRMVGCPVPVIWPPSGTGTADSPMRDLAAGARAIERSVPGVRAVTVNAGFAYADVPRPGLHLSAVVDPGAEAPARAALADLARRAWALRAAGLRRFPTVAEALAQRRAAGPPVPGRPDLIVEPADNIGGGAPGDSTAVLRGLIAARFAEPALVILNDPGAVARLAALSEGAQTQIAVGGHTNPFDAGPVPLVARLVSRSSGRFRLTDPNSHAAAGGMDQDMGPTAVVQAGALTVMLTSVPTCPFDLGQITSQGLDPRAFALIAVKAAVGHRRAYDPIAGRSWAVETPAPCPSDLRRLPYRRLAGPVYPIDPEMPEPRFDSP